MADASIDLSTVREAALASIGDSLDELLSEVPLLSPKLETWLAERTAGLKDVEVLRLAERLKCVEEALT